MLINSHLLEYTKNSTYNKTLLLLIDKLTYYNIQKYENLLLLINKRTLRYTKKYETLLLLINSHSLRYTKKYETLLLLMNSHLLEYTKNSIYNKNLLLLISRSHFKNI